MKNHLDSSVKVIGKDACVYLILTQKDLFIETWHSYYTQRTKSRSHACNVGKLGKHCLMNFTWYLPGIHVWWFSLDITRHSSFHVWWFSPDIYQAFMCDDFHLMSTRHSCLMIFTRYLPGIHVWWFSPDIYQAFMFDNFHLISTTVPGIHVWWFSPVIYQAFMFDDFHLISTRRSCLMIFTWYLPGIHVWWFSPDICQVFTHATYFLLLHSVHSSTVVRFCWTRQSFAYTSKVTAVLPSSSSAENVAWRVETTTPSLVTRASVAQSRGAATHLTGQAHPKNRTEGSQARVTTAADFMRIAMPVITTMLRTLSTWTLMLWTMQEAKSKVGQAGVMMRTLLRWWRRITSLCISWWRRRWRNPRPPPADRQRGMNVTELRFLNSDGGEGNVDSWLGVGVGWRLWLCSGCEQWWYKRCWQAEILTVGGE